MTRTLLVAEIMHETNTFNRIATTKADFLTRYWLEGDEVAAHLKDTNTEVWGFLEAARARGWRVVHPLAASASPSGPMAAGDWQRAMDLILAPLRAGLRPDAVVLVLHGSMVTETTLDAEADLVTAVRGLVGDDIIIAVTLDMHANISRAMTDQTNLMMAYRTYPHVDQFERAQHMARLLDQVFAENLRPRVRLARHAMIDAANHGQTGVGGPMDGLLDLVGDIETRPGVLCASIQIGFPWADVPDIGPSVAVSHAGHDAVAEAALAELLDGVWESRKETQLEFPRPEAAIAEARAGGAGTGPLVLADFADNPAGGAYGDSPNLLRAMIEAKLPEAAFATISDPETVRLAEAAGIGAEIAVKLGGKGAPVLTPPLQITARVLRLGDGNFVCAGPMWQGVAFSMGPSAVIECGGIEVIVSSVPTSVMDLNVFRSMGIEPQAKRTLGLKSRNHFRAAYGPIARKTMLVDAGGIASMRLADLDYRNIPRPIWPLDEISPCR